MNKVIRAGLVTVFACSLISTAFAAKNDVDKAVLTKYANASSSNGKYSAGGSSQNISNIYE